MNNSIDLVIKMGARYNANLFFSSYERRPFSSYDFLSSTEEGIFRYHHSDTQNIFKHFLNKEEFSIQSKFTIPTELNKEFHFAFLDFDCKINDKNENTIWNACKNIDENCFLYNSGNSYYAYFPSLMFSKQEYFDWITQCIKIPEIDKKWAKCVFENGYGKLRLNKNKWKHKVPTLLRSLSIGNLSLFDAQTCGALSLIGEKNEF